jgi:hypothetical protein
VDVASTYPQVDVAVIVASAIEVDGPRVLAAPDKEILMQTRRS